MGKKHITVQCAEELHGVSVCFVWMLACVCGRWGRYALNSSAERRKTQEPVNNSSNSILFLHDCSPALPSRLNTAQVVEENLSEVTCKEQSLAHSLKMFASSILFCAHILCERIHLHVHVDEFVCHLLGIKGWVHFFFLFFLRLVKRCSICSGSTLPC